MDQPKIIKVSISELNELQRISLTTFLDAFSQQNSEKHMEKYVSEAFSVITLKKELEDPDSGFYFAKINQETAGYLKMNFRGSQTEIKEEFSAEIERIYVLQKFQGKKIGQLLFEKAIELAKNEGSKFIWLGVWEKNYRAIRFYEKCGFTEFDKHFFMLGDDKQTDIMMKLELN